MLLFITTICSLLLLLLLPLLYFCHISSWFLRSDSKARTAYKYGTRAAEPNAIWPRQKISPFLKHPTRVLCAYIRMYVRILLKTNTRLFSHLFPQYFSSLVRFHRNCLRIHDRQLKRVKDFFYTFLSYATQSIWQHMIVLSLTKISCVEKERDKYIIVATT